MMDPFNDEYFMKQALVEARSAAESPTRAQGHFHAQRR